MPLHRARARICRPEGEGGERVLACEGQAEAVSVAAVVRLDHVIVIYFIFSVFLVAFVNL